MHYDQKTYYCTWPRTRRWSSIYSNRFCKKYNVTGWVRNLYDGTVEMEVQGLEHRVDLFLQELSSDRPGGNGFIRIDRLDISDIPSVNAAKETQFRARY